MEPVKTSRVWTVAVVVALALAHSQASVATAQGELRVGTWELNLHERSPIDQSHRWCPGLGGPRPHAFHYKVLCV